MNDIPKGTYLCEYRTTKVYHPKQRAKYEDEYIKNGEGSYLLETNYSPKLIFDATRCYDQFGRFINHSNKGNCNYWHPLFVRGKYRVGFITTRDISEGEELTYHYGIRNEPWMMVGTSPQKVARAPHSKIFSLEQYRRQRYCPVPGCMNHKPLKKLSNHLTAQHPGLSKEQRQKYLKEAKRADLKQKDPLNTPSVAQKSLSSFFTSPSEDGSSHAHKGPNFSNEIAPGKGKTPKGRKKGEKGKQREPGQERENKGHNQGIPEISDAPIRFLKIALWPWIWSGHGHLVCIGDDR